MKKKYYSFLVFILAAVPLLMANFGGSPGGRTGSPGDNGNTCATNGGCHGPKTPIPQEMISTDIGTSGYIPNDTVTVTISPARTGINKYGFEIIAEDTAGNPQGTFIGSSTVTATSGGIRATHKAQSTQGSNNMHMWTVKWVAPDAGTGNLKFHISVLAANNNGGTGGDNVLIDTLEISENTTVGINEMLASSISLYPNPATTEVHFNTTFGKLDNVKLYNQSGQVLLEKSNTSKLNVSQLSQGTYVVRMEKDGVILSKSFIKI